MPSSTAIAFALVTLSASMTSSATTGMSPSSAKRAVAQAQALALMEDGVAAKGLRDRCSGKMLEEEGGCVGKELGRSQRWAAAVRLLEAGGVVARPGVASDGGAAGASTSGPAGAVGGVVGPWGRGETDQGRVRGKNTREFVVAPANGAAAWEGDA
jgi:hypothetical protein